MAKRSHIPTVTELLILSKLWEIQPATIRHLSSEVEKVGKTYAVTQTLIRLMEAKGLVEREPGTRYPAFYKAAMEQSQMQQLLVQDLADRAFGGSIRELIGAARKLSKR